jgi:hypothetical protein
MEQTVQMEQTDQLAQQEIQVQPDHREFKV